MVTSPLVSWWLEDPKFNSGLVHYLICLCVLQLLDRIATCYTNATATTTLQDMRWVPHWWHPMSLTMQIATMTLTTKPTGVPCQLQLSQPWTPRSWEQQEAMTTPTDMTHPFRWATSMTTYSMTNAHNPGTMIMMTPTMKQLTWHTQMGVPHHGLRWPPLTTPSHQQMPTTTMLKPHAQSPQAMSTTTNTSHKHTQTMTPCPPQWCPNHGPMNNKHPQAAKTPQPHKRPPLCSNHHAETTTDDECHPQHIPEVHVDDDAPPQDDNDPPRMMIVLRHNPPQTMMRWVQWWAQASQLHCPPSSITPSPSLSLHNSPSLHCSPQWTPVDSRWTPENSAVIWLFLWNPSGL